MPPETDPCATPTITSTTPTVTAGPGLIYRIYDAIRAAILGIRTGFRTAMTERDNVTHDPAKWSWLISTLSVLGHDYYQLIHKVPVNVKDLAIALAGIAAAHGFAIGAKSSSDHPQG